jgi:bile acid:Na+ symporter, BASS family
LNEREAVGEFLEIVSKLAVLAFVVSCMTAAGLGLRVSDIISSLQRTGLVLFSILANFVIVPAIAYALTELVALDRAYTIGLLLLGGAAGAPFLPKLAELARGDFAFSVGLMLLLMLGSVIFMPIVLPLMIPGLSPEPWPLLRPLLFTMLLPLAAGMVMKSRFGHWSSKLRPPVVMLSNISLILTVVLLISLNFTAIRETFGSGAAAVGLLFVSLSLAIGYALGGPAPTTRSVLALGTGQRNIAAALLIGTQNFPDEPGVVVMLLVTTLAGLIPLIFAARWFAHHSKVTMTTSSGSSIIAGRGLALVRLDFGEMKR